MIELKSADKHDTVQWFTLYHQQDDTVTASSSITSAASLEVGLLHQPCLHSFSICRLSYCCIAQLARHAGPTCLSVIWSTHAGDIRVRLKINKYTITAAGTRNVIEYPQSYFISVRQVSLPVDFSVFCYLLIN